MSRLFRYISKSMNGVFAFEKPSGVTSNNCILELQRLFTESDVFAEDLRKAKETTYANYATDKRNSEKFIQKKVSKVKIKVGHGGTLDPLAKGVIVVGIGSGTKKLQHYLTECRKTYETKALLGISTTTGDQEGEVLTQNPIEHITKDQVTATAPKFIGDIKQTPPIFSALKMNGKPLYDYAREGKPLPKPIKAREVKVFDIKVFEEDSLSTDHAFAKLESKVDENGEPIEHLLANNPTLNDSPLYYSEQYLSDPNIPEDAKKTIKPQPLPTDTKLPDQLPMIHLSCDVSSGTYIRSLLNDYGRAMGSSAYMVELIRTKQAEWELGKNVFKTSDFFEKDERIWGPVLKKVLDGGSDIDLDHEFAVLSEQVLPLIEKEKLLNEQSELPDHNEQEKPDSKKRSKHDEDSDVPTKK